MFINVNDCNLIPNLLYQLKLATGNIVCSQKCLSLNLLLVTLIWDHKIRNNQKSRLSQFLQPKTVNSHVPK